jgi:hypothetical protein
MKENIHLSMHNTFFEIDLAKGHLLEVCNPKNRIDLSLFQRFDDERLWLPYGLSSKNISTLPSDEALEWHARMILPLEVLQPDFLGTDEQILRLNQVLRTFDSEIHLANYGLPIIKIEGTRFIVDLRNNRLCEQQNPVNEMSFSHMKYRDSGYLVNYDLIFRNINNDFKGGEVIEINLPHKTVLDPNTMASLYGTTADEIKLKSDFEIIVDQRLYLQRSRGKVPTIDLAGNLYHFYIGFAMEPKNKRLPKLPLTKFFGQCYSKTMIAYYNRDTGEIVSPDAPEFKSQAASIVFLELPWIPAIDPYGMAKLQHWEVKDYLLKCPLKKHITAVAIPIIKMNNQIKPPNDLPQDYPILKEGKKSQDLKEKKSTTSKGLKGH